MESLLLITFCTKSFTYLYNQTSITFAFSYSFLHRNELKRGVWLAQIRDRKHKTSWGESWEGLISAGIWVSIHSIFFISQLAASHRRFSWSNPGRFWFLLNLWHSCHCGFHAHIHKHERRDVAGNVDLWISVAPTPYFTQSVKYNHMNF